MPDRFAEHMPPRSLIASLLTAAMHQGIAAKGMIDRSFEVLLGFVGLPSRADLVRLQTKLDVLQGTVTNLSIKVDRLLDAGASRPGAEEPRTSRSG